MSGTLQRLSLSRRWYKPVALLIQKGDGKAWIVTTALIIFARYADGSSAGFRNVYAVPMLQNRQEKTAKNVSQVAADLKKGWIE